jgi:hypothetical protein
MDTGMTNLGSGGEAKASPADREDTNPIGPADDADDANVDQTGRGGTMDTALGAQSDPTLPPGNDDGTGTNLPRVGFGETAAYGETVENMSALGADDGEGEGA